MPADFRRHLEGKTLINVFTVISPKKTLCWQVSDHTDIFINQRIECCLNNTIHFRPLTPHICGPHVIPTKWRSCRGHRFCDVASPYAYKELETALWNAINTLVKMYTRPHQSATHAMLTSRCSIRRRSSHVRSLTTKGMDCMNCGKLQHGRDSVFSNVMVATAVWTHRLLKSTRISLCAFLFYCSERRSCRLAGINPNRIQTSKTKFVSF